MVLAIKMNKQWFSWSTQRIKIIRQSFIYQNGERNKPIWGVRAQHAPPGRLPVESLHRVPGWLLPWGAPRPILRRCRRDSSTYLGGNMGKNNHQFVQTFCCRFPNQVAVNVLNLITFMSVITLALHPLCHESASWLNHFSFNLNHFYCVAFEPTSMESADHYQHHCFEIQGPIGIKPDNICVALIEWNHISESRVSNPVISYNQQHVLIDSGEPIVIESLSNQYGVVWLFWY